MTDHEKLNEAEPASKGVIAPAGRFEDPRRDGTRKRRNQRIFAIGEVIAILIVAVTILHSFAALTSGETPVGPAGTVTGPAETGPAETEPPSAPTQVAPDGVSQAGRGPRCRNGALTLGLEQPKSRLKVTDIGDRIKARFEIYGIPEVAGRPTTWHIVLTHSGTPGSFFRFSFFRGKTVADLDGEVVVQRRVRDAGDRFFQARATDETSHWVCNVEARVV